MRPILAALALVLPTLAAAQGPVLPEDGRFTRPLTPAQILSPVTDSKPGMVDGEDFLPQTLVRYLPKGGKPEARGAVVGRFTLLPAGDRVELEAGRVVAIWTPGEAAPDEAVTPASPATLVGPLRVRIDQ